MIGCSIFNKKAIESVSNYPAGSPPALLLFFAAPIHDQRLNRDGRKVISVHDRWLERL